MVHTPELSHITRGYIPNIHWIYLKHIFQNISLGFASTGHSIPIDSPVTVDFWDQQSPFSMDCYWHIFPYWQNKKTWKTPFSIDGTIDFHGFSMKNHHPDRSTDPLGVRIWVSKRQSAKDTHHGTAFVVNLQGWPWGSLGVHGSFFRPPKWWFFMGF